MTKQEFNDAVAALIGQGSPTSEEEYRVCMAALAVMKHRRGIPDKEEWSCGPAEVAEFLVDMDGVRRKKLKLIADGFVIEAAGRIH